MNKKGMVVFLILLLCTALVASVVLIYHISHRERTVMISSILPICAITEKVHSDDYYLSVQLDKWYQEENKLPSDIVWIKCTKSVFEKASVGNDYIGAEIEIVLPADSPELNALNGMLDTPIGMLILENKIGYFTITSVTTSINKRIS